MRRTCTWVATAVILVTACSSPTDESQPVSGAPTSKVRVGLTEWEIALPSVSVRPGQVTLVVTNTGSTNHDLDVNQAGRQLGRTELLDPGQRTKLRVRVRSGPPLRLVCTVTGHRDAGMETRVRVAR